ncbi:MAG: dihydrolipoamide acetyltransferase family protein, partial [Chloroflexota bacterium]
VLMPQTGADASEGKIVRWLKHEGDQVETNDIVAEIETEKVNMEVVAYSSGTLYRILVPEGQSAEIGKPIATLLKAGEQPPAEQPAASAPKPAAAAHTPPTAQSAPAAPGPSPAPSRPVAPLSASTTPNLSAERAAPVSAAPNGHAAHQNGDRIKASPLARRLAQEHQLDLTQIQGRGPGGRVVKDDVEAALQAGTATIEAAPAPPEEAPLAAAAAPAGGIERPLTRIQLTAARRLSESKQNAPHFYLTVDVDMAEALKLRSTLNEQAEGSVKISVNDLVVKASAWALQRHPGINSSYRDGKLLLHERINISVAIATDEGLVSPVVPDVDRKSLGQIARETRALVERARAAKLRPEDYADGTFTISNLGMFNIETFIAIINPPQAAILAVGAVRQVPVVRDGQLAVGEIMKITLSADHRATDGAGGARFLADIRRALEKPLLMAL